jgi:hypothetical protein
MTATCKIKNTQVIFSTSLFFKQNTDMYCGSFVSPTLTPKVPPLQNNILSQSDHTFIGMDVEEQGQLIDFNELVRRSYI